MFFITFSNLWSFSIFFFTSYLILFVLLFMYLLLVFINFLKFIVTKNKTYFTFINSFNIFYIIITPFILMLIVLLL